MDKWPFEMRKNAFGEWLVQGRMTAADNTCKDNPAAGVTGIPLSGLAGTPAPAGMPAAAAAPAIAAAPAPAATAAAIVLGEWAGYGAGNQLMGMGFHLLTDGKYQDNDGKEGGRFTVDSRAHTIVFTGGFMNGQSGKNLSAKGFDITLNVRCEPWK
jgi:hypothetical protein